MYTCSITNIDLSNKEAVFIALTKNTERGDRNTKHIYSIDNDFKPALLPIFGKFDYEEFHIQKDKNTEILEEFFELTIEDIFETSLSSRNVLSDSYSAPFKNYKRKFDTSRIDSSNTDFNSDKLLSMDFSYDKKTDTYLYIGDDRINLKVKIIDDNEVIDTNNALDEYGVITYILLDENDNTLVQNTISKLFIMKYLVEDIVKYIGYSYIYEQDKKQNVNLTLSILSGLNGMFISKKVYDILVANSYSIYGDLNNDNDLKRSFTPENNDLVLLKNVVGMTSIPKYLFTQINPDAEESIIDLLSYKSMFFDIIKKDFSNKNIPTAMNIVSHFSSIYFNKDMDKELNLMDRLFLNMTYNNYMFIPNVMSNEDSNSVLISKIAELTVTESFVELEY